MTPQDTWVRGERQAPERDHEGMARDEGGTMPAAPPEQGGWLDAALRSGGRDVDLNEIAQLPTAKIPTPDIAQLPTAKHAIAALVPPTAGSGPTEEDNTRNRRPVASNPWSPASATPIPPLDTLTPTVPLRHNPQPPRPPRPPRRPRPPRPQVAMPAGVTGGPRRGPRALVLAALVVALLLIVAAVPLLRALESVATSHNTPASQASPTAIATQTGAGIADPSSYVWLGDVRAYAEHAYVASIMKGMTLDEELGQMIQVSFYDQDKVPQWALDEIARDDIGSVILYRNNLATADTAREWTSKLQSAAKIPLLLGTDEEGGGVNRLDGIYGNMTAAWQMAQRNDPTYARQVGRQFAQDIAALGMNSDYAPVVDVDSGTGAAGGELNGRMFGNTPGQVTTLAGAFLQGLQEGNRVVGCLKHFPGLGDSTADPHQKLATVDRSLDDLWRIDWAPYKSLIDAGQVDMIMSTHVVVAAVDPNRPASLSRQVITGILRDQLHFNGVVITDGVYMLQKQGSYDYDQSILYAIQAGNDIVSSATSASAADEALRVLRQGVQSGQISRQQIDDSVRRILLLKLRYNLLSSLAK